MRHARIITTQSGESFITHTAERFEYYRDTKTLIGKTNGRTTLIYVLADEEAVLISPVDDADQSGVDSETTDMVE